ncbi:prepilin-type N-terminal cleavage/methylation domain-containing protein [Oenococcus alcoholitolerans]|uniref:prepilin-type N-terminal cleavage/methylation domain-containing protein n=1 Tax=Oenococcus alcoholitolerans TaxID=931074 RepID=UPI003F6F25BF
MSASKSFTLIESVITLFIVSILVSLTFLFAVKNENHVYSGFKREFQTFFSLAQAISREKSDDTIFYFNVNDISFKNKNGREFILKLPKDYKTKNTNIHLKENGYVMPTTIDFFNSKNNKKEFSIIYSLGFGNYRFEKYEK